MKFAHDVVIVNIRTIGGYNNACSPRGEMENGILFS